LDAGSLLGATRHKEIIPWDDDIDICIFKKDELAFTNLRKEFILHNIDIVPYWGGYKIFFIDGDKMHPENRNWTWTGSIKENITYTYPFIDVYTMDIDKATQTYIYTNDVVKKSFAHHYHTKNNLFPLKQYIFKSLSIPGPNNPLPYLNRAYPKWQKIGYKKYDHQNMQFMNKKINL